MASSAPSGEAAIVDGLSKALGLPRPFPHELNRAFTTCETWQQLAAALAAQSVAVRPLGYYRTPDSVDIYVFEIRMGSSEEDRKSWRIYRRYSQFHKYVSSSSEILSSMVVPRLSQAYLKLFSAQTCTERLEELHAWLQGVVDNTQAFCRQQADPQPSPTVRKHSNSASNSTSGASSPAAQATTDKPRMRRSESSAGERTRTAAGADGGGPNASKRRARATSSLDRVHTTLGGDKDKDKDKNKREDEQGHRDAMDQRRKRQEQQERTATFYRLRMDSVAARPLLLLSCFLLAGANCPFPHYFRGLPRFALAMEEINVEVKPGKRAPAAGASTAVAVAGGVFPSRVRSSLATRTGLGLRLVPSHEQDGAFFGATVSGFSRELSQVDARLARVPVGARLVRVNGVDTTSERFDAILGLLSASGRRPLRMRFEHNPYATSRPLLGDVASGAAVLSDERARSPAATSRGSFVDAAELLSISGRAASNASMLSASSVDGMVDRPVRTESAVDAVTATLSASASSAKGADDSALRSYSVDARRNSTGLFGTVFGDLFGRKRADTADQALADRRRLQALDDARASWDDAGGDFFDILSRGFYTPLPPALLHELRDKRRRLKLGEDVLLSAPRAQPEEEEELGEEAALQDEHKWRAEEQRRALGVWSTATGPLGLCLGACTVCGKEAAMLEVPPAVFSSRPMGSETRLRKGFVLVSINNESTFGWSFARVAAAFAAAPRPTSVAFRWFRDYSPFLESDHAEKTGEDDSADPWYASGLDCVAEAQADLSTSLHLALVENASVRDAMASRDAAAREARVKLAAAERTSAALERKLRDKDAEIARLEHEGVARAHQLERWRERATEAEAKLATAKQEVQAAVERTRAEAVAKVAEHEERLVRESNRSIASASALAERRTQKLLDATVLEMQRAHDEYLQKLAEEHSEEVESLTQQVAVWRHQVEVLTEAEKRNYAALVHSGINPYGGAHRSRFGFENDPTTDNDVGGSGYRSASSSQQKLRRVEDSNGSSSSTWRGAGAKPGGAAASKKEPVFSAVGSRASSSSSGASQSQTGTFWDRMVSLIAAE